MQTRQEQIERMRREAAEDGHPPTIRSSTGHLMRVTWYNREAPPHQEHPTYGCVAISGAQWARNDQLTATNLAAAQKVLNREHWGSRIWALLLFGWGPVLIFWGMLGDWFHLPDAVALPAAVIATIVIAFKIL